MAKAKNDTERKPLPPYIPFKTFTGLVQKFHESATPERVDLSVLRTYSGAVARQIIAALKYLDLIEEEGKTTDRLGKLVTAYDTHEWPARLRDIIQSAYQDVTGNLNIGAATTAQLHERFRQAGADGDVLRKCVAFYVPAMTASGIALSPHILEKPRRRSNGSGRVKSRRSERSSADERAEVAPVGTVKFALPIPGKATATILLPEDLNVDDWEMINTTMRAYIQRREKGAK